MSFLPRRGFAWTFLLSLALTALLSGTASAQKDEPPIFKAGPLKGELGTVATIEVPAGYAFVPRENVSKFNKLTHNLDSPNELGVILPTTGEDWFIIFSYMEEGYVKDDEKDKLDAAAILETMKENVKNSNPERKRQGYPEITLVGWEKPPYYDAKTNNLTWAMQMRNAGMTELGINHEARLLGRGGSMSATLVVGSKDLAATVPVFDKLLTGFSYTQGNKYSEWKPGDKVAEYGLAGLVAGGALAVAAKTGILGKLLKPIIAGIVALGGAIAAFFRKLFGRGESST